MPAPPLIPDPSDDQGRSANRAGPSKLGTWLQPSATRLVLILWWVAGLLLALTLLQGPVERVSTLGAAGWSWNLALAIARLLLFGLLLFGLVVLGARMISRISGDIATEAAAGPAGDQPRAAKGVGFPAPPTVAVGAWLVFATLAFAVGLVEVLAPQLYIMERFPALSCAAGTDECADGRNLMVTMFAAGAGAMITTAMGYLEHASDKRDFQASFVPWYFARPAIAVMLGVVFYFLVKGGLLVTVGQVPAAELNVYGLAGLAALVGMFSKRAVGKLREVFGTLFSTASPAGRTASADSAGSGREKEEN